MDTALGAGVQLRSRGAVTPRGHPHGQAGVLLTPGKRRGRPAVKPLKSPERRP